MEKAILGLPQQFSFTPSIVNGGALMKAKSFCLAGMGGSHLAGDILIALLPDIPLTVYRSYGMPFLSDVQVKETLFIASSYSGNTEETLDFAREVQSRGLPLAVITVGGALLAFAQEHSLPHIVIPDTGIQPRSALGFSLVALAVLMGNDGLVTELRALTEILRPENLRAEGSTLAQKLSGAMPVIYASSANEAIAYNWKIKMNETGKIPAFFNLFPELNHNELAGMDVIPSTKDLSDKLHFIFISDDADHPRIAKRMEITKHLYGERGLAVSDVPLSGVSRAERIMNSLLVADWTAYEIAVRNGAEPDQVPIIEQFKKRLAH
jgi:glucose/mannose-6-phosphate isomerase